MYTIGIVVIILGSPTVDGFGLNLHCDFNNTYQNFNYQLYHTYMAMFQ